MTSPKDLATALFYLAAAGALDPDTDNSDLQAMVGQIAEVDPTVGTDLARRLAELTQARPQLARLFPMIVTLGTQPAQEEDDDG